MRIRTIWWLAGLSLLPILSQEQVLPTAGSALQFLNTQAGAEATALGGAFSAVADDPSAIYWNPAGIGWFRRAEIQTTYNQWFFDTYFQDLDGVFPTSWGAIGARLSYVNFGSFDLRDSSGNLQGSETPQAWAGALATSLRFGSFGLGLSLKGGEESYTNYSLKGGGLDAGALFRSGWASLALGARNIGQAGDYTLPTEFYSGIAVFVPEPSFFFRLSTDATLPFTAGANFPSVSPVFHHGIEWGYDRTLFIRAGYQWASQPLQSQDQAGFGGGAGICLGDFLLDYSIVSYGQLGLTNKIAVGLTFGETVHPKRKRAPIRASNILWPTQTPPSSPPSLPGQSMMTYYQEGIAEFQIGQYRRSADDLRKALSLADPSVSPSYYAEAYAALGLLYQFHAKFEGHLKIAHGYYEAALQKEPGNPIALKHLSETVENPPAVATPVTSENIKTLYKRGIAEYKAGQYKLSADDLRKAVSVENPSVPYYYYAEAYAMLGVLYQYHAHFDGHLKIAEKYYRTALQKEPGNATALKHLREIEKH